MTNVQIERFDLPALPAPKPGDDPVFIWDVYAELRAGEIVSVVKRFAYWDEKDNRPLEVGRVGRPRHLHRVGRRIDQSGQLLRECQ